MNNIKSLIVIIIGMLFSHSCIEEYMPIIKTKDAEQYVVNGHITNEEGYQSVKISYSTSIKTDVSIPDYIPISNCNVIIRDDKGNSFELIEDINSPGKYITWIDKVYLNVGTSYKIDIITPEGVEISSDYDEMTDCAEIDSVYFITQDKPTTNPDSPIQGIQYYTNLNGLYNQSFYYKFTIEETWEYHSRHYNHGSIDYDGFINIIDPPDSSLKICWKTQIFPQIFTLSTAELSENKYLKFPLHYVKSRTGRLAHGYSVLLKLHSLTENAFTYWEKVKNNIISTGGLYTKQPELVKGNLYNLTDPNSEVLGYFYATSVRTKRIFTDKIEDLELDYYDYCLEHLLKYGAYSIPRSSRPAYLYYNGRSITLWLSNGCVDCTTLGGSTTKPDFWPY